MNKSLKLITPFIFLTTFALTGCGNSGAPKSTGRDPNALFKFIQTGQVENVKLLIKMGTSVNQEEINGQAPLHYAAFYGNLEIAELLINAGAEVNYKNFNGNTPLHLAAAKGKKEIVKFLLEKKADPKIKNDQGKTALDMTKDDSIHSILKDGMAVSSPSEEP